MSIYAYCLLRLPLEEIWPILNGVGQHPVFPFRSGKYAMLLSRLERNFPFTPRSIVEHAQVVARAFETHTVLPMRFGTFFSSEKQIEQLIRENRGELVVDCAHLVETQRVAGYQRLLPVAEEHIKECTLRLTGPWPPYHFLPSAIRLPSYSLRPLTRKAAAVMRCPVSPSP